MRRIWISVAVGLACGCIAYVRAVTLQTTSHRDFALVWYAAGALLRGSDPYTLIGPGRAFEFASPFFYPLPAAVLAIPVAPLSEFHAVAIFMALGGGCLTWALMEHGYPPLLGLYSACVSQALYTAQWSPLIAGAYAIAPLSVVLVAKPTIGAAVFAARPSWWALFGGLALIALAFIIQPDWVTAWRAAIHRGASIGAGATFPYLAPIAQPGGLIPLLALLRWRRPEARLLAAMACVPQSLVPFEGVLLLLIPRGWLESAIFLVLANLVDWYAVPVERVGHATWVTINAAAMTMFLYVPATLMVLRRPNEGALPVWLERAIARWPAWLRGRSVAHA